jgi:hypothetical protein
MPAKRISRFINEAIRARLWPSREQLDSAYRAASRENWRPSAASEWAATEVEAWPE